jgi:hypothetical protein
MALEMGKPIDVWVEDERDFGGGGPPSKESPMWNVVDDEKGDMVVGELERTDVPTSASSAAVTAILRFNGDGGYPRGTVVAKGALPYENGDIGSGFLAITSGTGGHSSAGGVLRVDVWNPKRYRQQ